MIGHNVQIICSQVHPRPRASEIDMNQDKVIKKRGRDTYLVEIASGRWWIAVTARPPSAPSGHNASSSPATASSQDGRESGGDPSRAVGCCVVLSSSYGLLLSTLWNRPCFFHLRVIGLGGNRQVGPKRPTRLNQPQATKTRELGAHRDESMHVLAMCAQLTKWNSSLSVWNSTLYHVHSNRYIHMI
jgi:hypothetical protein